MYFNKDTISNEVNLLLVDQLKIAISNELQLLLRGESGVPKFARIIPIFS